MPPRHASQCRKGLQTHMIAVRDSIWITEAQLAAAFERYCFVSRQVHRQASNVPGPLESRRRLGKRQFADLNALHNTNSLPVWALPNAPDLSQWHWEAPTSAAEREERRQHPKTLNMLGGPSLSWLPGVRQWLGERPLDEKRRSAEPVGSDAAKPSQAHKQSIPVAGSTSIHRGTVAESFRHEIRAFCALPKDTPMDTIASDFRHLCTKYQQYLRLGHFKASEKYALCEHLWNVLEVRVPRIVDSQSLYLCLYSAFAKGMRKEKLKTAFINTVLIRMSHLPVDDRFCQVFAELMLLIPSAEISASSEAALAVLKSVFFCWVSAAGSLSTPNTKTQLLKASDASNILQALLGELSISAYREGRGNGLVDLLNHTKTIYAKLDHLLQALEDGIAVQSQVDLISNALARVTSQEHAEFLRATSALLHTQELHAAKAQGTLSYLWLFTLAKMPLVKQDALFETTVQLQAENASLEAGELCSLAMAQWQSRGYLDSPALVREHYDRLYTNESTAFAALLSAVFLAQPSNYRGVFVSFCQYLQRLGRSNELVDSFQVLGASQMIRVSLLQEVALAAKDHHIAMDLHKLYKYQLHAPGGPEWDPAVFRGYAKAMIADPNVRPARVWEALDIDMYEHGPAGPRAQPILSGSQSRHLGRYGATRLAIVEDIALPFSLAPHLPNRVALRHVSQCLRFLGAHGVPPSPRVLKAVYQVVTRDLAEGAPGRGTRLRWFLALATRHMDPKTAQNCQVLLQRWRRTVVLRGTQESHLRAREAEIAKWDKSKE